MKIWKEANITNKELDQCDVYWQNIIYEDTKFCTNSHFVVAATVSGEAQR